MDKTDLQKQFEEEQDSEAVAEFPHGNIYLPAYGEWCERKALNLIDKAEAYDRLMSGNATMKEFANITSHPVAIDSDGNLFMYYNTPSIGVDSDGDGGWWDVLRKPVKLPRWFASYDGNWEDSLTLPDGWETKGENT